MRILSLIAALLVSAVLPLAAQGNDARSATLQVSVTIVQPIAATAVSANPDEQGIRLDWEASAEDAPSTVHSVHYVSDSSDEEFPPLDKALSRNQQGDPFLQEEVLGDRNELTVRRVIAVDA